MLSVKVLTSVPLRIEQPITARVATDIPLLRVGPQKVIANRLFDLFLLNSVEKVEVGEEDITEFVHEQGVSKATTDISISR